MLSDNTVRGQRKSAPRLRTNNQMATEPNDQRDAIDQRDRWRLIWRILNNDWLLFVLCIGLITVISAQNWLPQPPTDGTTDPLAYSQWQANVRSFTNLLYTLFLNTGLFEVNQTGWVRILLPSLLIVLMIRLIDRTAQLIMAITRAKHVPKTVNDVISDEERVRVTDRAPTLRVMQTHLKKHHFRQFVGGTQQNAHEQPSDPDWVYADRAPIAEIMSLGLHLGLLAMCLGLGLNILHGWNYPHIQLGLDRPAKLSDNLLLQLVDVDAAQNRVDLQTSSNKPTQLLIGKAMFANPSLTQTSPWLSTLSLRVTEITPEFHVTANAQNSSLPLILSSYASAQTEAVLSFRSGDNERSVAIGPEPAKMALQLLLNNDATTGQARVYALPSGRILTQTLISPQLNVEGVRITINPSYGAVVSAQYQPGNVILGIGALMSLLGWLGTFFIPIQRIIICHHAPDWTEFYASGRQVTKVVRELISH
jgi:hypothetical protein